jgi:broad specificity phosphatase PhoE
VIAADSRRLILLRHGRTAWNAVGRFQGHTDIELDEVGLAQAEAVAPVLAAMEPVGIWSSDLTRARVTAETIGRVAAVVPVLDPRLREYDVGIRAGLTADELREQHPEQYAIWMSGGPGMIEGAEDDDAVRSRVLPAFTDFWAALQPGETGLVVMHGAALRTGLAGFLGWPPHTRTSLAGVANCGWVELVSGEDDKPLLAAYNSRVGA